MDLVAEAKAELLEGLSPEGLVVANRDDEEVVRFVPRHPGRVVWFSTEQDADYRVADVRLRSDGPGTRFRLIAGSDEVTVDLPLHGHYNVDNFLAAAACAHCLEVSLDAIAQGALGVQGQPMRGVVHRLESGAVVIDDCYNSNPTALDRALRSARELDGHRYWAVLGEMLELGDTGPELHAEAGRRAADLGFSPIVGVGELARELVSAAGANGARTDWFETAGAAAASIAAELGTGDVVLVKGSRGVGLEVVVEALLQSPEEVS